MEKGVHAKTRRGAGRCGHLIEIVSAAPGDAECPRFPPMKTLLRSWLVCLLIVPAALAAPSLLPTNLRCEYRANPLGIGETHPRLGWQLAAADASARGLRQTAWQILVASSPELLAQDRGDRWDSGRVASDAMNNVVYAGRELHSRDVCCWKVRVWDQAAEPSGWSQPATWTLGLLDSGDWKAEWIGLDPPNPVDRGGLTAAQQQRFKELHWMRATMEPSRTEPLAIIARKMFSLPADRKVAAAILLVSPDDDCTIAVNGRASGEASRWDRIRPLDVTPQLTAGENTVTLQISQADGYPPAAIGTLDVAFADGGSLQVPIDETWKFAATENAPADAWRPLAVAPNNRAPWGGSFNAEHNLTPAPYLRKAFAVAKPVRRATIYATALGVYELELNGTRVGVDHFAPGWTDYRRRVAYQTYDVTAQVRAGRNALGATLGDGWFASTLGGTGERYAYGALPRVRAQLEIEFTDGIRETIATDPSWRASFGAIRYADNLQGCAYDARLERPDWATADFDDHTWSRVSTGIRNAVPDAPAAMQHFVVEAGTLEPPRVMDELPARAITQPTAGVYIVDFGQNLVGWVRFRVHGRDGQRLRIRHGEMLNPNGTLYGSNLRGAAATDYFWLRAGDQTLEPKFTFHGFRYAEVTGLDAAPAATDFTGMVVHNPLPRTGDFACSNPLLNQLFHNIIWGQKGNYFEAPTDCPQRDERLGWTGDTQFFIRTGAFNFDVAPFIERWLVALIDDSQAGDGTFSDVAPDLPNRRGRVSTAWGDAALLCTHALWQVYGDTRVIERHYDALKRYMAFLDRTSTDGIAHVGGYGDWLDKGGTATPPEMDTAYYAHLCRIMADMGNAIGRTADAEKFAARHREVVAAWQRAFLLPDGKIKDSGQTGFALAFTMDLLPAALRGAAAGEFVKTIEAANWHLTTGFIGTPRLLPALQLANRDDVAYRLLLQDTYPSWLFQVKLGATTMWERWDGWTPDQGFQAITMNSFNHYAFGAVGEYLYRGVGGIDTDGPGFRQIVIAPQPGGGLTEARASYDAISGKISSAWQRRGDTMMYTITVPPNTTATIRVPATDAAAVREGDRLAQQSPGVEFVGAAEGSVAFRVGSGTYQFGAPAPK
jgi:alpha-L-rhamnosidase